MTTRARIAALSLLSFLSLLSLLAAACGGAAAIEDRVVDPHSRAPIAIARIALPDGAKAASAWLSPTGGALVALRDGRLIALDDAGHAHAIDRRGVSSEPVVAFVDIAPGVPLALDARGAWRFDREVAWRADLPEFLGDPRSLAPLGDGALWATSRGLFATDRDRWLALSRGAEPMRDVRAVFPRASTASAREAWLLDGAALRRLRIDADDRVTWLDASPGVDLGPVRMIAALDGARLAALSARGVAVIAPDRIVIDHAEPGIAPPDALAAAGGFAWVGWAGQILRTDGERWESLARGLTLGPSARIAVDEASGASALVIDANGDLVRIDADEALHLAGFADRSRQIDTRLDLDALPGRATTFDEVSYILDGRPLVQRKAPPWGWGDGGAPARDLREIGVGVHVVDVVAKTRRGALLRGTRRFDYASPFGRVPSYARDVAPIFAAHCARCHESGVARDLATYERLRAQSPMVRAAVREARMPPDLLLDGASVAVITAWVDGDSPP